MLEINKLSVYYDQAQALNNISLEVNKGELVILIGGNGAGKTTTLKTISGLLKPQSGSLTFKGVKLDTKRPSDITRLGIVQCPEGRQLFPEMSVLDNLQAGAYVRTNKKAVTEDLEWVFQVFPRLKERKNQKAGTLSGGEQQMLAIGRSLMAKPELFMLDEPSLGLAPKLVNQIADIIKELRQAYTILLVEQNARMALDLATRGYVLRTGQVLLEGSASELKDEQHIKNAYLASGEIKES